MVRILNIYKHYYILIMQCKLAKDIVSRIQKHYKTRVYYFLFFSTVLTTRTRKTCRRLIEIATAKRGQPEGFSLRNVCKFSQIFK